MLSRGNRPDVEPAAAIAERVAVIEADITALLAQLYGARKAILDAKAKHIHGDEEVHGATLAQEHAEMMVEVIEGQIEEQFAARDALIPRPRQP